MDFGNLLNLANKNNSQAQRQTDVKRYTTDVPAAKKLPRSKVNTEAIKALLNKKDEDERRKVIADARRVVETKQAQKPRQDTLEEIRNIRRYAQEAEAASKPKFSQKKDNRPLAESTLKLAKIPKKLSTDPKTSVHPCTFGGTNDGLIADTSTDSIGLFRSTERTQRVALTAASGITSRFTPTKNSSELSAPVKLVTPSKTTLPKTSPMKAHKQLFNDDFNTGTNLPKPTSKPLVKKPPPPKVNFNDLLKMAEVAKTHILPVELPVVQSPKKDERPLTQEQKYELYRKQQRKLNPAGSIPSLKPPVPQSLSKNARTNPVKSTPNLQNVSITSQNRLNSSTSKQFNNTCNQSRPNSNVNRTSANGKNLLNSSATRLSNSAANSQNRPNSKCNQPTERPKTVQSKLPFKPSAQSLPSNHCRIGSSSRQSDMQMRPSALIQNKNISGVNSGPSRQMPNNGQSRAGTAGIRPGIGIHSKQVQDRIPGRGGAATNGNAKIGRGVPAVPRPFPPRDFPPRDVISRPRPNIPIKRPLPQESEDEDSDMDDFIDDDPSLSNDYEQEYSSVIRDIFKYDKNKFRGMRDDDIQETSYSGQLREEFQSTKAGLLEDLEDIRREKAMKQKLASRGRGRGGPPTKRER